MIELQPESVVFVRAVLATTVGILVLFVGKALNQRVGALREYNIPEPVTGGLLVAVGLWALYLATGYRVIFELHIRDVLLVYFFTTIGLNARFSDLKAGGRPFVVLCLLVSLFLVLQDALAVALAKVVGWSPSMGLLPYAVATPEQLVERVMDTLRQLPRDLDRYMTRRLVAAVEAQSRDDGFGTPGIAASGCP
jgi:hypothetical protein